LTGGVPDADDTAGALLALHYLGDVDDRVRDSASAGVTWLLNLQNSDGGIPTFCRGWGTLPFDRSSPDLTAHALRAWAVWRDQLTPHLQKRIETAIARASEYLAKSQLENDSWIPLWFGNQHAPDDINPTYGTARVLQGLQSFTGPLSQGIDMRHDDAACWLYYRQNEEGGWSGFDNGDASVEETALAVEALAGCRNRTPEIETAIERGCEWLIQRVESDEWTKPSPIGFYFAKLWYYERLYPVIFTVGALERVRSGNKILNSSY
jgi:squalene-hopene/tetraprenyl-beta-curcumene cyclase